MINFYRRVFAVLAFTLLPFSLANAIPMFSRPNHIPCSACHTGDFKLNDFGELFDGNGYQLPGTIDRTPVWENMIPPISLAVQDRESFTQTNDNLLPSNNSHAATFNSQTALLLSGGTIAPHVSYMTEYDVENTGNGELTAGLEYAFINLNNLFNTDMGQFNIRLGKARMELPFELTPEFYAANYLIYNYPLLISTINPLAFQLQMAQYGASVFGRWAELPFSPDYQLAISGGDAGEVNLQRARLIYFRVAPELTLGTIPTNIGLTLISGSQTIDPSDPSLLDTNNSFTYGIDWQLQDPWINMFTIWGQVMRFHNSNIQSISSGFFQDAAGGYLELDAVAIPEKLTLQARYDWLQEQNVFASVSNQQNLSQVSLTARWHLMPNVHLFIEGYNLTTTTTYPASDTQSHFYVSGGFFFGL